MSEGHAPAGDWRSLDTQKRTKASGRRLMAILHFLPALAAALVTCSGSKQGYTPK